MSAELIRVDRLCVEFSPARGGTPVRALDDVSLAIQRGETLGVVGESGCGKTTLIRCIARLLQPQHGTIALAGEDITHASGARLRRARRQMQIVFQDPEASLNPRRRVGAMLARPLRLSGVPRSELAGAIVSLLGEVGLAPEHAERFAHELSGGQRQRVGIARALALQPPLLLLDEPVSALDVSIRAQIVNLLGELRQQRELTCIFVAHDLALVRHVSDRIAVMDAGRIVELGAAEQICAAPRDPRTRELLASVPVPDPRIARTRLGARPAPTQIALRS